MPSPAPARVSAPAGPPPAPVFVDDTGRRHRFVRAFGWVLAAVITVYLGLLAVSLVASPGLVPLSLPAVGSVLPGPAAPSLSQAATGRGADALVPTAATDGARTPASAGTAFVSAGTTAVVRLQPRAHAGTAASVTAPPAAPRPATSPTPAPSRTSQGKGTPQASPHSSTHPAPRSTHARGAAAQPSPSPASTATP